MPEEFEWKCDACDKRDASDAHACPYACQVNDDCSEDYCNCCPECEQRCAENI